MRKYQVEKRIRPSDKQTTIAIREASSPAMQSKIAAKNKIALIKEAAALRQEGEL